MFTYEEKDTKNVRETYEWDNIWWEHAENTTTPRVLAIGDSISCGWRTTLNQYYDGKIYVDGFGSSKGIDNAFLLPGIKLMASQMPQFDVILFNNGLHGFHLSDEEYAKYYEAVVTELKNTYSDKKFFILLTTPVRENTDISKVHPRTDIVKARNAAAAKIAADKDIPIIDLFSILIDHPELYSQDGVHLTQEGYQLLASTIADAIRE